MRDLDAVGERVRGALRARARSAPLPDGFVTRLVSRLPARQPRQRPAWLALAPVAAVVAGLLVLVGAYLLWSRPTPLPPATDQPTASPLALSTPSPSASPTAAPTRTPSPPPTPLTADPWIELAATRDGYGSQWAPDSRHLLLRRPRVNGHPNTQFVDLFDRDGTLVRTYQAVDEGVWLDGERFVLTAWERYQPRPGDPWVIDYEAGGQTPGTSFLGSVSSEDLVPLELNLGAAVSNGHGALAIYACNDCFDGDGWSPTYRIWTPDDGLTEPRPGLPEEWSPDGTLLRLEHPLGDGPARESWYQIIRWPGGETYYADPDVRNLLIDPSWTRAAVFSDGTTRIIDLATGEQTSAGVVGYPSGYAAWDGDGRLYRTDYERLSATVYDTAGNEVGNWPDVGNGIAVSADGSTLAFYDVDAGDPAVTIAILRGDVVRRVTTPGGMNSRPLLSPDGRSVFALCYTRQGWKAFILEL